MTDRYTEEYITCVRCGRKEYQTFLDNKPICVNCNGTMCMSCCSDQKDMTETSGSPDKSVSRQPASDVVE